MVVDAILRTRLNSWGEEEHGTVTGAGEEIEDGKRDCGVNQEPGWNRE